MAHEDPRACGLPPLPSTCVPLPRLLRFSKAIPMLTHPGKISPRPSHEFGVGGAVVEGGRGRLAAHRHTFDEADDLVALGGGRDVATAAEDCSGLSVHLGLGTTVATYFVEKVLRAWSEGSNGVHTAACGRAWR